MKILLRIVGFLLLSNTALKVHSQAFLNGDFETISNTGINFSNAVCNSSITDVFAFGTTGNIDILQASYGYGSPQNGSTFLALTGAGTDALALKLSGSLVAGQSYTISFYDRLGPGYTSSPFQLGISTNNTSFGTVIYTAPTSPASTWTKRTTTFVAPISGQYITVQTTGGTISNWAHVDNFSFDCSIVPNETFTDASCGQSNGIATLNPTGGTSPYTYLWSNGQTSSSISNLAPGTYSVTITDQASCTVTVTVVIANTTGLTATTFSNDASCSQNNGSASISVSGGTLPYMYVWSNGQTTSSISNLSSGNYTVTVTDNGGCSTTATITLTDLGFPSAVLSTTDADCGQSSGTISSTVSGGSTPYTYLWSNGETTSSLINLFAGSYSLTVTDANGCTTTASSTVNNKGGATLNITTTDAACGQANGSATAIVSGGIQPFTYLWDNGQTTATAVNLVAGNYSVTMTDATGCTAIASTTVNGTLSYASSNFTFESQNFVENEGVEVNFFDASTNAIQYYWEFGDGYSSTIQNPTHTYTDTGTYAIMLVVTDQFGCTDTLFKTLTIEGTFSFFIPNSFSANDDHLNDSFLAKGVGIKTYEMNIFNRWGSVIFSTKDITKGWDGKINGNYAQDDTYLYSVLLSDFRNKEHRYMGRITIIK